MSDAERVERLLKLAFTPVEPPEALSDRLERGLTEMADAAADELADWELSAMSDPRNWVRPTSGLRALERSLRDVADDLEKRLRR
jgi:hypothetical protein